MISLKDEMIANVPSILFKQVKEIQKEEQVSTITTKYVYKGTNITIHFSVLLSCFWVSLLKI